MYLVTIQSKANPQATPAQSIVMTADISDFISQNLSEEIVLVIQEVPLFNIKEH